MQLEEAKIKFEKIINENTKLEKTKNQLEIELKMLKENIIEECKLNNLDMKNLGEEMEKVDTELETLIKQAKELLNI